MAFKETIPPYITDKTFRDLAEIRIARFFARVEHAVAEAEKRNGNTEAASSQRCQNALQEVLYERNDRKLVQ